MVNSRDAHSAGHAVITAAADAPRLLVVDDDNLHRMIICRVAAKAGYAVAGAAGYDEAVELLRTAAFDCIALDLSLGQHRGVEMLRHLHESGCKTPIVIISGCDDATRRESLRVAKALDLNVSEPVAKPVDLVVLRYWLDRFMSPSKLSRGPAPAHV